MSSQKSLLIEVGLFPRLIEGIPRNSGAWSDRGTQDHDLEDFEASSDAEIAAIAMFLHQQSAKAVTSHRTVMPI